jgi:hypothetical protein
MVKQSSISSHFKGVGWNGEENKVIELNYVVFLGIRLDIWIKFRGSWRNKQLIYAFHFPFNTPTISLRLLLGEEGYTLNGL